MKRSQKAWVSRREKRHHDRYIAEYGRRAQYAEKRVARVERRLEHKKNANLEDYIEAEMEGLISDVVRDAFRIVGGRR